MVETLPHYWSENVSAAQITSMKAGGAVRYLAKVRALEELQETVRLAGLLELPVRVIGGGSNLILSDEGFGGVAIQPLFTQQELLADASAYAPALADFQSSQAASPRYGATKEADYLKLEDAVDEDGETTLIRLGAGVPWGQAVIWTLNQGLVGLHLFARIPCHVGGAVYNNIHGGSRLLSEFVVAVEAFNAETGETEILHPSQLEFGYDASVFHRRRELVVVRVVFALPKPKPETVVAARTQYLLWTKEKTRVQPAGANCGSVFQNLRHEDLPAPDAAVAAAWYVDQAGLRGYEIGGLQVYPNHANFIVNRGEGTQGDFIKLVRHIRQTVHERFHVWLTPEAECMGPRGEVLVWEPGEVEPTWSHDLGH